MNTRRSFVRSMLGAAALAIPLAALTRHADAHEATVVGYLDEGNEVLTVRWPEYSATSIVADHCEVVLIEQMPHETDEAYHDRVETARAAVDAVVNQMNFIAR